MNRFVTLALVGVCGSAFIGYCIYFDKKRRSHPDFRKKLIEKRQQEKATKTSKNKVTFPDLRDEAAVQRFFLEQIQKGEEYLAQGNYEDGVEHLTNAIAVCGRPQHLLGVLKANIPPEVFKMLTDNLSTIGERLATSPTMMMAANKAASVKVSAADSTSESKITEIGDAPPAAIPILDATAASIVDVDELE